MPASDGSQAYRHDLLVEGLIDRRVYRHDRSVDGPSVA